MRLTEVKNFNIIYFQKFLKNNSINHYSGKSSLGAVFAERFNRTIRDLFKQPVFERDGNWVDKLPAIKKQYNKRIHSSTKLSPIEGSSKTNEGFVYQNLSDKRKKIKPKYKIHNLVRTAVLTKMFSTGDSTNWSYRLYEITEIVNDTLPSLKIDQPPERYNEAPLKKTQLTLKENDSVMKKLNIT